MKTPQKPLIFGALLLGLLGLSEARPVRVLFLKVVFKGAYNPSSIKNGTPYLESMLADPAGLKDTASLVNSTLGTGEGIVVPVDGFRIDTIGNGTIATAENISKFVSLLDSIDVLVLANTVGFGGILSADSDRARFLHFADTKGIVALYLANDPHSNTSVAPTWASYDSICGAMFKDWATANATVLQDSLPYNTTDSTYPILTRGLRPAYRINEKWMSFTTNPRPLPGMHILFTLNEKDYTPGTRMGDHPISWYRNALSGNAGRYYFTGLGGIDTLYRKNYLFRRSVYNAIVWASGDEFSKVVAVHPITSREARNGVFRATVTGSTLVVTPLEKGDYKVTVRALDGRRIVLQEARDGQPTTFSLRPRALYSVTMQSGQQRRSALVAVP